jgi:DNA polymerase III delta prime subunit
MEYIDTNEKVTSAWTDKYKPTKISDIIGNEVAIKNIITWLNTFNANKKKILTKQREDKKLKPGKKKIQKIKIANEDENEIEENEEVNEYDVDEDMYHAETEYQSSKIIPKAGPKSCMIVTGNHGIGKTGSVHVILKELGYDIQIINFSKVKSNKNIKDVIERVTNGSNILGLMDGKKKTNVAIVIDELESITSSTEKNCIMTLLKNNEVNWLCPIIFISNNQHNKLLSDIKKNSLEARFWQPYAKHMIILLDKIIKNENINISNSNVKYTIIEHSQKDFRRLIFILQDIKYAFGDTVITEQLIDNYCESSTKKDIDFDLFRATDILLQGYSGIDDCLRYYETEKVLLPLMMHQNYIKSINSNIKDSSKKYDLINEITTSLSKGDVIENYIYGDQNWDMHEVHGYYTCVAPSYLLNENLKKTELKLDFPIDLNKTSIKKINRRNILNASKCLKNMDISDYIYLNQIVRNLIGEGRIGDCVKLLSGYNIKLESIESLLKVDKIKSSKTNLTSKQKKELTSYLGKDE